LTTTPTTSQTTTYIRSRIGCHDETTDSFLEVDSSENCTYQVDALNGLLDECARSRGLARTGTFTCDTTFGFNAIAIVRTGPGDNFHPRCISEAAEINSVLQAFAFTVATFGCSLSGHLKNDLSCSEETPMLSSAVSGYIDGSFQNCVATTNTVTPTTTVTMTTVPESIMLYTPSLSCDFLDSTSELQSYHINISLAISSLCRIFGGACDVSSSRSECAAPPLASSGAGSQLGLQAAASGGVITEVSIVTTQLSSNGLAAAPLMRESIDSLAISRSGVTVDPVLQFPLQMSINLGYPGDLTVLAPAGSETRTILLNTLQVLVGQQLPEYHALTRPANSTALLVPDLSSSEPSFQLVIMVMVLTIEEFRLVQAFDGAVAAKATELQINFAGTTLSPIVRSDDAAVNPDLADSSSDDDTGISTGLLVGIIIAALTCCCLLVLLVCGCCRDQKNRTLKVQVKGNEDNGSLGAWWEGHGSGMFRPEFGGLTNPHYYPPASNNPSTGSGMVAPRGPRPASTTPIDRLHGAQPGQFVDDGK